MRVFAVSWAAGLGFLISAAAAAGPFSAIYDLSSGMGLSPNGIPFQNALYHGYVDLSQERRGAWDFRDAELFNHKARTAARRSAIQPDQLDDRVLGPSDAVELYAALGRLNDVFLKGGRQVAPALTGDAQVRFDCWIEAAEAGRQADVERCRAAFEAAIAEAEQLADYDPESIKIVLTEPSGIVAATPATISSYLVFFDWDSAVLTPEALDIVRTAATNAGTLGSVRIELIGHADRSGPEIYNLGLSQRRADAVREQLIRLGIPEDAVATLAKGESEPLVATPDGVREPQNRRVLMGLI